MIVRFAEWLGRHPVVKTIGTAAVSAAGGAVVMALTGGTTDPKMLARVAGSAALAGVYGLFVKRPQDVQCGSLPAILNAAAHYMPCSLRAGHTGAHLYSLRIPR